MSENFGGIEVLDGIQMFPELQAVLVTDTRPQFASSADIEPLPFGKYKVAPWGADNLYPNHLLNKIEKSDVVGANLKFTRDVAYGLGPQIVRCVERDKYGRAVEYVPLEKGPEYDWFLANDIPMFIMQQLTDLAWFHNAFAELCPGADGKIKTLRHKEAVFSRWSFMTQTGDIKWHYYCTDWTKASEATITCTRCLDEFDTINDLKLYAATRKRMIFPTYMPSPGKPYYSRPEWHSIFSSGWYDHSTMVPELKKAILKNQLGVKYIIYIAPEYFNDICQREGINPTDRKAYRERVEKEKTALNEFLSGASNANKAILALKKAIPTSGGNMTEQKWIEIETVKTDLKGGEYIDDTESTANIICYAMGVHSSLIGATPGKSNGSLGGTQARELYLMKQATMKPMVDRALRVLRLIKQHNGWDDDIYIQLPEYIFTTLDQNKSGKQESTTAEL